MPWDYDYETEFKIPVSFVYGFAGDLLKEAGVDWDADGTDDDLVSLVYEAGERSWERNDDNDFFYINRDHYE